MSSDNAVTEEDFRAPEYRGAKVEDYERRSDGKIVRKDRWETALRSIAIELGFSSRAGYEIADVVARAEAQRDALDSARNGLQWYRDQYPAADSGADDEMMTTITRALGEKGGDDA